MGGRRPMSFRFDAEVLRLLVALQERMRLSATSVIVVALRDLAKKEGVE